MTTVPYSSIPFGKAPDAPPRVRLIADDASEVAIGSSDGLNWAGLGGIVTEEKAKPWDTATPTNRRGATTFQFDTPMLPNFVSVNVFEALDDVTRLPVDPQTGERIGFGSFYLHCSPPSDGCAEPNGDVVIWDILPKDMFPVEFVSVGAHWFQLPDTQGAEPVTVWGAWLFHFVNQ